MLNPIMPQDSALDIQRLWVLRGILLYPGNGLARWTSNAKVVGSTPTLGAYYYILGKVEFQ